MTPERWRYIQDYGREVFGREDAHLARLMPEAVAAGLPDISVSAETGRLLMMLTSMTRGRLALEVGTLGGYSAIWIARGLAAPPDGRLITIELEARHADFAQRQFQRAGVADRVEIRRGAALEVLPKLMSSIQPGTVDVVFLDAEKVEYPAYWDLLRPSLAIGGLILADNAYGSGSWHIDSVGHPSREAAVRFHRMIADDPAFDAVVVPLGNGVLIGRRMR